MIHLYTKTICPFCQMAKQYLNEHKIDYVEFNYDDDNLRQTMYDDLGLIGQQRTVPQIIIVDNGKTSRIGGYGDLLQSGLAIGFNEDF